MNNKIKTVICVILSMATFASFSSIAFAAGADSKIEESISVIAYEKTEAEIDAEMAKQMQDNFAQAMGLSSLQMQDPLIQRQLRKLENPQNTESVVVMTAGAEWKNEKGAKKTISLGGFAGNQVTGGYRFATGGGFYHSDSGGPSVGGSISFSTPFGSVGVSISLGNKGTSGQYVAAPDKTNYYKLHITKQVEVEPWIIYTRPTSKDSWRVWSKGSNQVVKRVTLAAKKA